MKSKILGVLKNHWVFLVFIVLHLAMFNVNVAEWGDSYRILRASEFIRKLTYPSDEKRPPLFSLILAIRPGFVDQVFWGRIVMFFISVSSFWYFKKLCLLLLDKKEVTSALLLFTLNPIYFYWSIRIMADVPFSLLAMIALYRYLKVKSAPSGRQLLLIGFISGLAILTRFEGYILTGSIGLTILLSRDGKSIKRALTYGIAVLVTIAPWILYRNPFSSSYFDEPVGRSRDFNMFLTYIVSVLFMFGFTSAFSYLYKRSKNIAAFFKQNEVMFFYIGTMLLLILFWSAGLPRLLIPVLPFMIIMMVKTTNGFEKGNNWLAVLLLVFFVIVQYFLRLPFLVSMKAYFVVVVLLQVAMILFKKNEVVRYLMCASMFVWLLSSVFVHKNIYASVKDGASYAANNLSGVVGYNDMSSISDWYLNRKSEGNVSGSFFTYTKREQLDCEHLHNRGFDYLLMTNEYNTDLSLDIESRYYLEVLKDFEYEINGKTFFTKVIKINSCEFLGYNLWDAPLK